MGCMSNHISWYKSLVGSDTEKAASDRAGITTSTLNRQLAKGHLSEGNVIAIARAYGANPVDALARTGYITAEEAAGNGREIAELLSDQELIRALALRINPDEEIWSQAFGTVVNETSKAASPSEKTDVQANVYDLDSRSHDDLIERINAGIEPVAAQEATEPLEEHHP